MKSSVRKAVIPVAGLGTRFLPATKSVPKELLPLVDKPILLYIFEEIVAAGISEVILIQGRGKTAIEEFFDTSYELEDVLAKSGKQHLLKDLEKIRKSVEIITVRQHQALGLGHAILTAQPAIGTEPFAVLLGDEIMLPVAGSVSATGQLCQLWDAHSTSTVAVMEVEASEVSKYGIVAAQKQSDNLWRVSDVVEKPAMETAPSRLALPGRYVFDAKIFEYLSHTKPGKNGEIQLTDGMVGLAKNEGLLATKVKARRFDAGDKLGFLKANVEIGLDHPEVGIAFKGYLQNLVRGLK